MKLLIDGYNLMYGANITGRPGPGTSLHRSRQALLQSLAELLTQEERQATTIVFDAQDAPPGLPKQQTLFGIRVLFAPRQDEADDLIIQIIRASTHARDVTVVSSDHRVQVAARRQGAATVDSDEWFQQLKRRYRQRPPAAGDPKPIPDVSEQELLAWLTEWESDLQNLVQPPPDSSTQRPRPAGTSPDSDDEPIFPRGYGEDLTEDNLES